jgi:hypothetical protein
LFFFGGVVAFDVMTLAECGFIATTIFIFLHLFFASKGRAKFGASYYRANLVRTLKISRTLFGRFAEHGTP